MTIETRRVEKVVVEDVNVAVCDNPACMVEATLTDGAFCPQGWLSVVRRGAATFGLAFCSRECVRQWAAGDEGSGVAS